MRVSASHGRNTLPTRSASCVPAHSRTGRISIMSESTATPTTTTPTTTVSSPARLADDTSQGKTTIAASVVQKIAGIAAVERMTGLEVIEVNIAVNDIHLPEAVDEDALPPVHSARVE